MNKYLFSLCICYLFYGQASYAQFGSFDIHSRHYKRDQGLSSNHINSTLIGRSGQVFFLSENNLGIFKNQQIHNEQISPTFSNKGFNRALEDNMGNLWLSENEQWYSDFQALRVRVYKPRSHEFLALSDYIHKKLQVYAVAVDPADGQVYIGTRDGDLYQFDARTKHLTFMGNFGASFLKITGVSQDCIFITIGTDAQCILLNKKGKRINERKFQNAYLHANLKMLEQEFIVVQPFKKPEVEIFNASFTRIAKLRFPDYGYIYQVYYDPVNQFIILNNGHSLRFYDKNFKFLFDKTWTYQIHHVAIDKAGNYFISSDNGIHIHRYNDVKIKTFLHNEKADESVSNISCRGIQKLNEDEFLVNTNNYRQLIDLRSGKVSQLHGFMNEQNLRDRFVLSVLKDAKGNLIFGDDHLVKTNLSARKDYNLKDFPKTKIWCIKDYKDGYLLGLENNGIQYFDLSNHKLSAWNWCLSSFEKSTIYDFDITDNELIVASDAGLHSIINEKEIRQLEFPDHTDRACFDISEIDTNRMFCATSAGIWLLDKRSKKLSLFSKESNAASHKFLAAYQTKNGVWASSEAGVWHFNDAGKLLKIYTETDGLSSNECNRISHLHDENDLLYFGGVNGVNVLNPSDFSQEPVATYAIKIDSLFSYAKGKQSRKWLNFREPEISLNRSETAIRLTLDYNDFNYFCPKNYYYRTKNGIDESWRSIASNELTLENLPNGITELEVKVVSCQDFVNEQILVIRIIRPQALYQLWYFWLSVFLLFAAIGFFINFLNNRRLKLRNIVLQQKVDEQTRDLRESLKLKERLLGILAHDVRYPTQSFYDISKKLRYLIKKRDFERMLQLGEETEAKSRKVLWLIDELVYWVKNSGQTKKVNSQTTQIVELQPLVNQLLETYQDEITQKRLRVTVDLGTPTLETDPGLMLIILRNTFFNAIIHSASDSEVFIRSAEIQHKGQVEIINRKSNEETSSLGAGIGMSLIDAIISDTGITIETFFEESTDLFKTIIRM